MSEEITTPDFHVNSKNLIEIRFKLKNGIKAVLTLKQEELLFLQKFQNENTVHTQKKNQLLFETAEVINLIDLDVLSRDIHCVDIYYVLTHTGKQLIKTLKNTAPAA